MEGEAIAYLAAAYWSCLLVAATYSSPRKTCSGLLPLLFALLGGCLRLVEPWKPAPIARSSCLYVSPSSAAAPFS